MDICVMSLVKYLQGFYKVAPFSFFFPLLHPLPLLPLVHLRLDMALCINFSTSRH